MGGEHWLVKTVSLVANIDKGVQSEVVSNENRGINGGSIHIVWEIDGGLLGQYPRAVKVIV